MVYAFKLYQLNNKKKNESLSLIEVRHVLYLN